MKRKEYDVGPDVVTVKYKILLPLPTKEAECPFLFPNFIDVDSLNAALRSTKPYRIQNCPMNKVTFWLHNSKIHDNFFEYRVFSIQSHHQMEIFFMTITLFR